MKRLAALAGLALALAAATTGRAAAQDEPAAQSGPNHAAVVIDTGDGTVRKFCLAFPEDELSGIEALRRVDTRPNRFETFAGKGSGVCMLCGVGCASGDCFCDPSKYWAYHRSGPGESQYQASRTGASNTSVRNGDVEAWKWGTGTAPAKTTVSEVCGIPEPPARTTAATTTSAVTPTTAADDSPPTSESQLPSRPAPTPAPTSSATPTPGTPTTTTQPNPAVPEATPAEPSAAPDDEHAGEAAAAPSASDVKRSLGAEEGAAAETTRATGTDATQLAGLAAFAAVLGGLLVWKARIRRSKVRPVRPVR